MTVSEYLSVCTVGDSRDAALKKGDQIAAQYFNLAIEQVGRLDRTIGRVAPEETARGGDGSCVRVLAWSVEMEYRWLP